MNEFQIHLPTIVLTAVFLIFSVAVFLTLESPEKYLGIFLFLIGCFCAQFSFIRISLRGRTLHISEGFLRGSTVEIPETGIAQPTRGLTSNERYLQTPRGRRLWRENNFYGLGKKVVVFNAGAEKEFRLAVNKPERFVQN